ncbi:MAG: hypothetical protein IKA87_05785, partial [Lentisphaeria bacterium]|nr:hypothetical protein [Lentisphaeria bacterium]
MEWRYLPMDIENGKSFKTFAQVIPFTGLPKVSGAGGGVAGALVHSEKVVAGSKVPVEIKLFDGCGKRKLTVELLYRDCGRKIFKSLGKSLIDFKKPGAGSCRMSVPVNSKSVELEAAVCDGKKEIARLNSIIRVGEDKTPWSIDLLENKIKADLRRPDTTCFTHVEPEADAVPWAKPLAGKKLKVLALGPKIPQLGDFTHRFDMEYHNCWIREDGQGKLSGMAYLLGDFAGKATINDVIANLRKAVSKKYDVILIAGISWRIIPKEVQKAILKQVSEGAGLVYTAVNEGHKFLNMTGAYKRTVKRDRVEVVKNSPLTSGVPLDFLPVEKVFDLSGGGEVHAKAGNKPYIVSAKYGEGRIVGYCYYANVFFTGLIPCDDPEPHYVYDRPTPYEFFYAMLAKGMLYAAKRELPLKTENFVFKSDRSKSVFTWDIISSGKFEGSVEYFITDRHNEIRSKGTRKVSFAPGKNHFALNIPVSEYGGKQLVSLIFRDAQKNSAGFGSWSFMLEPAAKISDVVCDKKSYVDGETIKYEVKFSNLPFDENTLRVELSDSYGRILARKEGAPAMLRKGSFVLRNQLPSRYSRVRAYLVDKKKSVSDTGGTWFYTRPADKLMKWDDYKIASIIYWDGPDSYFRMKRTAEAYRRIGLDILFNNWGLHR